MNAKSKHILGDSLTVGKENSGNQEVLGIF